MNKQYIIWAALLSATSLLGGCRQVDLDLSEQLTTPSSIEQPVDKAQTLPYIVRVHLTPEEGLRVERLLQSNKSEADAIGSMPLFAQIRATHIERVFPPAGRFEARTREAGLHLWYDITLDERMSESEARLLQQEAIKQFAQATNQIESVELVDMGFLPDIKPILFDPNTLGKRSETRNVATPYFNDDKLPYQWHYHNDGSWIRSVKGADINLFKAWDIETGKPNVIVSVVDGGVDHDHEDLRDNMYVNQAELNGTAGVDDDKNGYVDDIYGYNFVTNKGQINPHEHGTHVAGTIAARNNNRIGVCGVAGGNGQPQSGVRVMSCQTFDTDPITKKSKTGNFEKAIKYGADNGAVISQNSWGTRGSEYLRPSTKAAIDYFIKNAGCDEHGNQRPESPMKGGVVIFAAGNDGSDYRAAPASYSAVVSVSAMAPNFEAAPYTNRGDWVTIMAPGGDAYMHNGQVLSTLPHNQYGYMQGTSMACPHVSGIAALIVSKFGGPGFTNEELKKRLTTAILPFDINLKNPEYAGRLGVGYIDAAAALVDKISKTPPQPAKWNDIKAKHTGLELSWQVSSDADDVKAFGYELYVFNEQLSMANLNQAQKFDVKNNDAKVGQSIRHRLGQLAPNTTYYFGLIPYDRWGNKGELTVTSAKTLSNHVPVITIPKYKPIRLSGKDTYDLELSVTDADGHSWQYELVGSSYGTKIERREDKLLLHFRVMTSPGKYTVKVKVTDILGAEVVSSIPFEIYRNVAPRLTKSFTKQMLPLGRTPLSINLKQYFADDDDQELSYSVRTIGTATVSTSIEAGVLTITGTQLGLSGLEIVATDLKGAQAKATLDVEVVKDELVHLIYPNPVTTTLRLRLADRLRQAMVRIFTPTGAQVLTRNIILSEGTQIAELDVRALATGSYILQVEAEGKTFRQSFIKR